MSTEVDHKPTKQKHSPNTLDTVLTVWKSVINHVNYLVIGTQFKQSIVHISLASLDYTLYVKYYIIPQSNIIIFMTDYELII